jgi:hypothetical protein
MFFVRWLAADSTISGAEECAYFLQVVVLDLEHVVEAQLVGQLDLL